MSIEVTYKKMLMEEYLKTKLRQGTSLSALELIDEAEAINETYKFGSDDNTSPQPLFNKESYKTTKLEESSSEKMNNTFSAIIQDLKIAFTEMKNLNKGSVQNFDRWQIETNTIRKDLLDLEEKVENLLMVTQDTEGYFSVISDNFTDLSQIDTAKTSALVNIENGTVSMSPNEEGTNLNLNIPNERVRFRIRAPILTRNDLPGVQLKNIFDSDISKIWHTELQVSSPDTVICELIVQLGDEPVEVTRIEINTMEAGQSGPVSITPLYSTDDLTYNQLPIDNYTAEIRDVGVFFFPKTTMKYVKFIIAKTGPDPSQSIQSYSYQFGFKSILFQNQSFNAGDTFDPQTIESKWLHVIGTNGDIQKFEKLTLKVCEIQPDETSLQYYLATTNNDADTPIWNKITPIDRTTEEAAPKILDSGRVTPMSIDDISIHGNNGYITYAYISNDILTFSSPIPGDKRHYPLTNTDKDGFLNYLMYNQGDGGFSPVDLNESSLIVWRNVGNRSTDPEDKTGWRFQDPYWYTIVTTESEVDIDIGNASLEQGTGSNDIFDITETASVTILPGTREIRIHKDYYSNIRKEIQDNVDFYASKKMEKVSVFDMLNNVSDTDYSKYAIDFSLPLVDGDFPKKVFVVKKDPNSINEKFKIEFNQINQLKKYVKFKAELSTNNSTLTPCITGYQLKLG
jgi:hypothetical protein